MFHRSMSTPKRHHFLPEFYLNGFTRDGMLWIFDRALNEYRHQQPKDTAVRRYFYSIKKPNGERDVEVEKLLSYVEGKAKPIIDKLDRGEDITPEDRVYLSLFLAVLHSRVPKFEREMNEIVDQAGKAILKYVFPNQEIAAGHIRRSAGKLTSTPAELVDFIQNERFTITGPRNNAIVMMLKQAPELAKLFNIMDWTVVHAERRASFITTDAPFAFLASEELLRSGKPVLAVGSFEIVKAVPLTSRTCLLLGGRGLGFGHTEFNRERVHDINLLLAKECERFVLAVDESLLKSIVARSRIDRQRTGTRMRVDHFQHPKHPNPNDYDHP
jgi:hypothetical protein